MRLIYTDEAGTSAKEPVCVVASVIVEGDDQLRAVVADMNRLFSEKVPESLRAGFVFHATEIFNGKRKILPDQWPFEDRLDFLKEVLCLPQVHDLPISLGVQFKLEWSDHVDLKNIPLSPGGKSIDSNQFSHVLAFDDCMERADFFLRKYLNGRENGLIIAEDLPNMKNFLEKFGLFHRDSKDKIYFPSNSLRREKWQEAIGEDPESVVLTIDHIIDVPLFVKKGLSPLLQLADACAFAFRRCLSKQNHGDDMVLAMLGPEGESFVNDPVWFSDSGSGLFNTVAYWNQEQKQKMQDFHLKYVLSKINNQQ